MPQERWVVRGRVQGVGFRWFVQSAAAELGLAGDVRNRPDGAVEVRVRGPAEELAALHDAVRRGPRGARVEAVERQPAEDTLPATFTIRV